MSDQTIEYKFSINLDERGEFYADLRDDSGETVWDIHTDEAHFLAEDGIDPRSMLDIATEAQDRGIMPRDADIALA